MTVAAPGEGRYARVEREQRWVLSGRPGGLGDPVSISDRYLTGTRLRLRRMTSAGAHTYKLGQKVRLSPDQPGVVSLTTIYLSADEFLALSHLGGDELTKIRWRRPEGRAVVDEFAGPLTGLVLAEVELGPGEPPTTPPPLAVAEVTDDDRFSGGTLARLDAAGIAGLFDVVAALRAQAGPNGDTAGTQEDRP